MNTPLNSPDILKNCNGEKKSIRVPWALSLFGILFSVVLAMAYSNCAELKSHKLNSSNNTGNFGSDFFGTQNGDVSEDQLKGNMGFEKPEIREDESTKFSWAFDWSSSDVGYQLESFTCNEKLFGAITGASRFLNVTGGCDNRTLRCSYHANGELPVSGLEASTVPYSCEIRFKGFSKSDQNSSPADVKISVALKVNPRPQDPPPPPAEKCEGSELLQGTFERCNDAGCVGWAFEYGQVATNVHIRAIQSGERSRNVTITTTTAERRSDVDSYLGQQGCLNTGNLLSQFTVSKSAIDAALRAATASRGTGSGSKIQLEAVVVGLSGGRSIGFIEDYQPLAPIDPEGGGGTTAPVSKLSFVSGPYNVGITGSAENFPADTKWCLVSGNSSCDPGLLNMQDWASTGSAGSGRFNWRYEIRPYQVGWCPGTYTAVIQAPNEIAQTASFTIGYPNFYAESGGMRVHNVPPPSVGTLKACFEYDVSHGPDNQPGSCYGKGQTAIINNGWSYDESSHTASYGGGPEVFGGHNGTMFFTFEYNCGVSQSAQQRF